MSKGQIDSTMVKFCTLSVLKYRCLLSVLFVSITLHAQFPEYSFRHINRQEGLSQSNVTCIVQDEKGFMWFGTRDGLNKYDGYEITVYKNDAANERSLCHNYIRSVFEDSKARLWVGTEDGVNLYNRDTDSFSRFRQDPKSGVSANKIKVIREDSRGRIWIGTGSGLNVLHPETKTFLRYDFPGVADDERDIEDILEDQEGNIWVATWNAGLISFHPEKNKFERYRYNKNDPHSLGSDFLKKLFIDRDHTLWIGTTEGGLNRYDRSSGTFTRYQYTHGKEDGINNNDVLSIAEDGKGYLWVGTQNGGINILNRHANKFSHIVHEEANPDGLNSGSIYTIYKDRQANMWVGTFSGGVNFWSSVTTKFHVLKKEANHPSLNNNNVLSVYEDEEGDLFIGTDGGGLNLYNKNSQTIKYLLPDATDKTSARGSYPLCIYHDRRGNLWVGGFYGGASVYDKQKNKFYPLQFDTDINHVAAIREDSQGLLWMGTWGQGLVAYNPTNKSFKHYLPSTNDGSISHTIIFAIYEDRSGNLWVGTEGSGLNLYDRAKDNFSRFTSDQTPGCISNNIVNCIFEDSNGDLWIGTSGGLNQFHRKEKKFTVYSLKDGMPSDVVQAIAEDKAGNLWISTNNGVAKFDVRKKTFRNYGVSDGLQSNSFNRLSCYTNNKGEIYFGGVDGLNFFHPDSMKDNAVVPPVYFTELQIFNKPVHAAQENSPLNKNITEVRELTLSHRQSVFSFEFVALNYTFPEKNQYAYKLEGFDQDWNYIGSQRRATYTNLDAGTYVLKVKAANNDGVWNEEGASMTLIITPPFWKTWWAKTCYALVAIALLFILRRVLVQRMKIRNRLEMDEMKLRFYANISHEFRTPLTLILGPLNQLNTASETWQGENRNLLGLMYKNGQRLLKLIDQLMHIYELDAGFTKLKVAEGDLVAFCKVLKDAFQYHAERKAIRYSLDAAEPETKVFFDHDKLEKILLNLLSNAFKYTGERGVIHVKIEWHAGDLSRVPRHLQKKKKGNIVFAAISVQDSGLGIPKELQAKIFDRFYRIESKQWPKDGSGIGLSLARQLALSHYGDIVLESEAGRGSTFTVWLPVNNDFFQAHEIQRGEYDLPVKFSGLHVPHDIDAENHIPQASEQRAEKLPVLLIVEDNADIRGYLRQNLEPFFQIAEAENGRRGLEQALDLFPDIVISDVMMPDMDGVEMTRALKNDIRTSHIAVILLTARADEHFQLNAFEHSLADDYITKPFSVAILLAKLRNMVVLRENLKRKLYNNFITSPAAPAVPSMDEIFLKKAVEVVEDNMDNCQFNIERFCREMGMSQTNLYRKLQGLLGISGNQFIRDIRMKRAAQLLSARQYPVSEVAMMVGFADPKYFSQAFKKQFGVLPTEFTGTPADPQKFETKAVR
ncbi:response regulator [Fulvivirgaceae bacterium PWU4]|uniref:histidine kinase n=1 Tax=Chryseosolibacter histidini TaxID=2782349 RepID=A0AAP2DHT7_9BACT|nr:hybrid sensor histidine kinase/response regulator transcription factor [Chryseosolibacter histidini]MBT1696390.1 response regulator [Chryseosolibacter histidini]